MVTTAYLNIWNKRVGAIAWNPKTEVASFEFESDFLKNKWDVAPIKMPLHQASRRVFSFPELRNDTFKGLPGLLADILPDKYGNALINAWLSKQGRPTNSLNPIEMLCFIGSRGMGALEIEPAEPKIADKASKIEIISLIKLAETILTGRKNINIKLSKEAEEKALFDILKIGTSAGGARAKAVIAFNPTTKTILSGQANAPKGYEHWLLKFDGVMDKQFGTSSGYGRVEMAYYLMAKDAAIEITPCRLLEENGRAHFMTKRFDRAVNNEKIHVQSFCALQHYNFNDIESYSYEQLFETMRFLDLPYPQAEQLFRRMVFNVMSRNCDDHTKNFSFIMDKTGTWKLSPAYDICHAYRPNSEWVNQHALSINGKRKDFTKADLLSLGSEMNVKKSEHIIQQIAEVVSNWNRYANAVEVDPQLKTAIEKTLILIK